MKGVVLFSLITAVMVLGGCNPAPSTALAPDPPAPQVAPGTPTDLASIKAAEHASDTRR